MRQLRIIHHLARSGGTLFSRCLGVMPEVRLFSEIHPKGLDFYHPLQQAQEWYGLYAQGESPNTQVTGFSEMIQFLDQRCRDRNLIPVIRDWNHLDFTGIPFCWPEYEFGLVEALEKDFQLIRAITVRHPLDQWLSLEKQMPWLGRINLEQYMLGVRRFAEHAKRHGFLRYEDFTASPPEAMKALCDVLDLEYDPAFLSRWQENQHVTGDVVGNRAGGEIRSLPRKPVPEHLRTRLRACKDYQKALELLDYSA